MRGIAVGIALGAFVLNPFTSAAEPITLKLSFFTSDRSIIYQYQVKPFVDAVNAEGHGLVAIKVYFSGAISRVQSEQPKLVLDGAADLAFIVPARTPGMFSDTAVVQLPGLFRDQREASLVFTHLIQRGLLQGYSDFFVVGAYVAETESIHSRKPINSVKDLAGLTIRTNNEIQAALLARLGAKTMAIPINETTDAISAGTIDGATFPPSIMSEFGVARVARYHYMAHLGGAPTALVMNRKTFESLPPPVQAIIRQYSGEWMAERNAASFTKLEAEIVAKLKSDSRRTMVFPTAADQAVENKAAASVIEDWAAQSQHNRELLSIVRAEIAKLESVR